METVEELCAKLREQALELRGMISRREPAIDDLTIINMAALFDRAAAEIASLYAYPQYRLHRELYARRSSGITTRIGVPGSSPLK